MRNNVVAKGFMEGLLTEAVWRTGERVVRGGLMVCSFVLFLQYRERGGGCPRGGVLVPSGEAGERYVLSELYFLILSM